MTWFALSGILAGALALAVAGALVVGAFRWRSSTRLLATRLESARRDGGAWMASTSRYHPDELAGLPAPVQRYFRAALTDGQPIISAVTFAMTGMFNQSATAARWKPFTSRQRVITRRPGFLWDARISMLPGLRVHVIDSYIAGTGRLHAAVAGLFGVADMSGEGDVARDEFMRFFAEAPWYPTALLPSQGVHWAHVDERSAHATITDGPLTLTLLFRFYEAALVVSVRAEARGGLVDGKVTPLPWECRMADYTRRSGMMVPDAGEAAWMHAQERRAYFRGTLTSLAYEFAP